MHFSTVTLLRFKHSRLNHKYSIFIYCFFWNFFFGTTTNWSLQLIGQDCSPQKIVCFLYPIDQALKKIEHPNKTQNQAKQTKKTKAKILSKLKYNYTKVRIYYVLVYKRFRNYTREHNFWLPIWQHTCWRSQSDRQILAVHTLSVLNLADKAKSTIGRHLHLHIY